MTIQETIQKAIEGGWKKGINPEIVTLNGDFKRVEIYAGDNELFLPEILLDPAFWQCLGKAKGWSQERGVFEEYGFQEDEMGDEFEWQMHWHLFIDHLIAGKSIESYFETL